MIASLHIKINYYMRKIRVAVNGYGVIGKRIADAIALQADMELVGITDVVTDWRIKAGIL